MKVDEAEIKGRIRELTNQVKLKEEQVEFFKNEAGRRKTESQDNILKLKEAKTQVTDLQTKAKKL